MKFKVGSKALYSVLSGVSKVINSKNTMAVLDNFLIGVEANRLTVTASDTETTLSMSLELSEAPTPEGGRFLVNARRLADIAKELPDVDIEIDFDPESYKLNISFPGGTFDLVGDNADLYPDTVAEQGADTAPADQAQGQKITFLAPGSQVVDGINSTLFAVGTDDLRPQMMGIFWDIKEGGITFVATDTRKLVRYINSVGAPGVTASFILPSKPSNILKTLLTPDEDVTIDATRRYATFSTDRLRLTSRFTKGNYPDYNRVIPKNNPCVATVDRVSLLQAVRRVAVCADPSHGMIKFRFSPGSVELKVDDANYSTFANEQVTCDYSASSPLIIGFGAGYLVEILNMLPTTNVVIRLADPSRPGVFLPDEQAEKTDLVAILMPMTVQEF